MKKHKQFILSVILVSILLVSGQNARAFDLSIGKIIDGAKKGLDKGVEIAKDKAAEAKRNADKAAEDKKRADEEAQRIADAKAEALKDKVTANSQIDIDIPMPEGVRHAMIVITKNDFKENVVVDVDGKNLQKTIYLRAKEGKYSLKVFQTTTLEKYGVPYSYVSELNVVNSDTRDLSFLLPSEEVQSNDEKIKEIADELTANVQSDAEKIKRIHNFVAKNIDYDWQGYRDGTFVNNPTDAISVLNKGITVCEGYSKLFAAIARAAGFRVAVIHGKALVSTGFSDHAWNEVMINGEWKIVDVTWDDMNELRYDYLFPTAENFAKDHRKETAVANF